MGTYGLMHTACLLGDNENLLEISMIVEYFELIS